MTDGFANWVTSRGGFFTRAEAKDCGYRDSEIQDAVRLGVWVRLRHGYYAIGDHYAELTPIDRHRLLASAVQHRLGPTYVLVGISACATHGIELWDADLSVVHVARIGEKRGRTEAGIQYHDFAVDAGETTTSLGNVGLMNPSHAVWQASSELSTEGALVCMNSALHNRIVSKASLDEMAPAFTRWRGSRTARLAHRLCDARVETVGESRTLYLCWEYHLPKPEPQYEVYNAQRVLIARTDFGWPAYRHVCEFDGKVKYVRYLRPGESVSDAVLREKYREDLVRAEAFGVSRVIWGDIEGNGRRRNTAQSLRSALQQSKRLYTRDRTILA